MNALRIFERKVFRTIYDAVCQGQDLRIKKNAYQKHFDTQDEDIVKIYQGRRISWLIKNTIRLVIDWEFGQLKRKGGPKRGWI